MKKYNVTLSNKQSIFDQRDNIETAEDAVSFASGRGSSYKVYISACGAGDNLPINANYHTGRNIFSVNVGDGWEDNYLYMTPGQFVDYIRKNL